MIRYIPLCAVIACSVVPCRGDGFTNRYTTLTTQSGVTFSNARPTRITGNAVVLVHSRGITSIPISELPENARSDLRQSSEVAGTDHAEVAPKRRPETININLLYGLTREELRGKEFPEALGSVRYYFTDNGLLAQLTFTPDTPLSLPNAEALATDACQQFLLKDHHFFSDSLHAYRNLPGFVRTINFGGRGNDRDSFRVTDISLFFNLEWNETRNEGLDRMKLEFEAWKANH